MPISMRKGNINDKKKKYTKQKVILISTSLLVLFLFIVTSVGKDGIGERIITIGSKDYTEQAILGNMVADIIEDRTDIKVNRKLDLGGTQICFGALQSGDIDMYIEYSGTAYTDMLKNPPISDMNKVYNTVKSDLKELYDIEVLKQMNFNNTYVLAVSEDTAKNYNLETISDLAKVANNMKSATTFEFSNREDGLVGLQKKYNFEVGKNIPVDSSPRYTALINEEVDIIDAFSTDGLLKKFKLKALKDDKGFFPPYYAIPIIKGDALKKFPEIESILEELGSILTDNVMMELNYKVDELQEKPEKVAKDFLKERELIE